LFSSSGDLSFPKLNLDSVLSLAMKLDLVALSAIGLLGPKMLEASGLGPS